jgi:hypothetical protein
MLHALEHGATSRRGLRPGPDRKLAPCRVAPARVDQHDAGRLLRVRSGEQAREHPAVGVPDQHMAAGCRRRQAAVADRRSRRARRARRASAGCCRARRGRRARACRLAQLPLDVAPGRAVAPDSPPSARPSGGQIPRTSDTTGARRRRRPDDARLRAPPAPRYGLVGHELVIAKPVITIEQQFAAHGTDGEVFTERDRRRLLAAGQGHYAVRVRDASGGRRWRWPLPPRRPRALGGRGRWVRARRCWGSRCVHGRARSRSPAAGARSAPTTAHPPFPARPH